VAQRKVYPTHFKKVIINPRNTDSETLLAHLAKPPHRQTVFELDGLTDGKFKAEALLQQLDLCH